MAHQTEDDGLKASWRALSGKSNNFGWETIPLNIEGTCQLLAARSFPNNTEALILCLPSENLSINSKPPEGQGFKVEKISENVSGVKGSLIALSKLPSGNLEMFTMMADDIVNTIQNNQFQTEQLILQVFLARIKAWQSFMDEPKLNILTAEEEVGLFGELVILKALIMSGLSAESALNCWRGPTNGIHDFLIGNGALEVKSTISQNAFLAKISSLDQLDNSVVSPLFLAAVSLLLNDLGKTLPEYAVDISAEFNSSIALSDLYACRLIEAGLFPAHFNNYKRKFKYSNTKIYTIDEIFPKLVRSSVPMAIAQAKYEINLALVGSSNIEFPEAIKIMQG